MDVDGFWQLVEEARAGQATPADADEVAANVVSLLATKGEAEILAFHAVQDRVTDAAYRWDLWAAAYLINGGCSDDGFEYFQGWLLAQGRRVWDDATADPDSLAALFPEGGADDYYEGEDMTSVASTAYEQVTGDLEAFWDTLQELHDREGEPPAIGDPAGENFDFDDPDEMRARLPRLAELFLDGRRRSRWTRWLPRFLRRDR